MNDTRVAQTNNTIDEIFKLEETVGFKDMNPETVLLANIAMSLAGIYDLMNAGTKSHDISGGCDDEATSEV